MRQVNVHQAKTHLSRLIEEAVGGEPFVIAKAGRPMVRVEAVQAPRPARRTFGFLAGQIAFPADIDSPFQDDIEEMFVPGEP